MTPPILSIETDDMSSPRSDGGGAFYPGHLEPPTIVTDSADGDDNNNNNDNKDDDELETLRQQMMDEYSERVEQLETLHRRQLQEALQAEQMAHNKVGKIGVPLEEEIGVPLEEEIGVLLKEGR